jgi:hypothetical protein
MSTSALRSYFANLAVEMELDTISQRLTIVVDNAHIPLRICCGEDSMEVDDDYAMMGMSKSLSAIHSVTFPPSFLKEKASSGSSRWKSVESSSSSDVCLSVPQRSWERPAPSTPGTAGASLRGRLSPALSMDSTAKLLRALPMESATGSSRRHLLPADTNSSTRRNSPDGIGLRHSTQDYCTFSSQEDLPSLKGYPFDKIEPYPRVVQLQEISKDCAGRKPRHVDDSHEGEPKSETFSYRDGDDSLEEDTSEGKVEISIVSFDRWQSSPPLSLKYTAPWPTTACDRRLVMHHPTILSPRSLSDFPLPSRSSPLRVRTPFPWAPDRVSQDKTLHRILEEAHECSALM